MFASLDLLQVSFKDILTAKCWPQCVCRRHDVKLLNNLLWITVLRPILSGADPTVDGGLSLSLGLATRSECLLQLEENELCLSEIQLAIREGFPAHRRCLTACPFTSGRHMQGWANH